ncbi:MAG: formate dehydrogenase accessory sulfurtransferase FdhD [Myxococcales bacterium]|nr:formate dehydrogenase accessory sulfurtransferase FdhD [Myxococcales bacterium]
MRLERKAVAQRRVSRAGAEADDSVAVEEPLDIRVAGETVAVTMRTPGADHELALGFLFSEGVLHGLEDVGSVFYCGRADEEGYGNSIEVTPAPGAHVVLRRVDAARRGTLTTAACGICGRQSIDDLIAQCGPVPAFAPLPHELLAHGPLALRGVQPAFDVTGGIHAAAVLDRRGAILASAEDVGRHNAVDKAVGMLLRAGQIPAQRTPGGPEVLVVSGRASFEIVQKAAVARLAAVVSVSAASSLAIDLATRTGLVLASFARGGAAQLYAGAGLVTG